MAKFWDSSIRVRRRWPHPGRDNDFFPNVRGASHELPAGESLSPHPFEVDPSDFMDADSKSGEGYGVHSQKMLDHLAQGGVL